MGAFETGVRVIPLAECPQLLEAGGGIQDFVGLDVLQLVDMKALLVCLSQ